MRIIHIESNLRIIRIECTLELDTIRYEQDNLQPDTFYVTDGGTTFWSPDGEGGFFYDTLEEALEQHA